MSCATPHNHSGVRRLGRSVTILLPVIAACLGTGLGLAELVEWNWPDATAGYGFDEDNFARIRDAADFDSRAANETAPKLTFVIGSSSTREAISVPAFNKSHSPDRKIIALTGVGSITPLVIRYMDRLAQSSIQPDHIVIGLSPYIFSHKSAGDMKQHTSKKQETIRPDPTSPKFPDNLAASVQDHRTQVSLRTNLALRRLRHLLLDYDSDQQNLGHTNSRPHARFDRQNRNPFREVIYLTANRPGDEDFDLAGVNQVMSEVARETENLSIPALEQTAAPLLTRIGYWLKKDVPVTVIFVPQSSVVRRHVAADACDQIVSYLRDSTAEFSGFRLINLRDTLPDQAFGDPFHISPDGRRLSVPLLAPLMAPEQAESN